MKKSFLISVVLISVLTWSCQQKSEEVQVTTYEVVGEAKQVPGNYGNIIQEEKVVTPVEMVAEVEAKGTFSGKISGEIKEVCTKKGCWFSMELPLF